MTKESISSQYQDIQDVICSELEKLDGKAKFKEDLWKRDTGGGGKTRIITGGDLIEKGGVNFSEVYGDLTPAMQKQLNINGNHFFACGISIVLHPNNPHVPIIHMNIRYFELDNGNYWFGGGIDLTPHIIIPPKAQLFHQDLKNICDRHSPAFYSEFKINADNYFFIPHRNETRGVGGIFYDHLTEKNTKLSKSKIFEFSKELGLQFPSIYKNQCIDRQKTYSVIEKNWQLLRRGRYVEFNLVNDRGTKFGLFSNGRTESILMSLPENARWVYSYNIQHKFEKQTQELLKKDIDWVNYSN